MENALSDFTKVIEITPDFVQGYSQRGQIYLSKGEYEQAISDFTTAIKIDLKNAEAYFNRSLAYFALGNYDKVWDDIHKIESFGYSIPDEFLSLLRQISNRRK